jgi:hypothetical protein
MAVSASFCRRLSGEVANSRASAFKARFSAAASGRREGRRLNSAVATTGSKAPCADRLLLIAAFSSRSIRLQLAVSVSKLEVELDGRIEDFPQGNSKGALGMAIYTGRLRLADLARV